MALFRLADLDQLPPGEMRPAHVQGLDLVVCNDNGTIHILDGICPHRNAPLAQGNFVDGRLICPWHAWEFRCDTGCLDYNPAIQLRRYPASIQDGAIFVELDA